MSVTMGRLESAKIGDIPNMEVEQLDDIFRLVLLHIALNGEGEYTET